MKKHNQNRVKKINISPIQKQTVTILRKDNNYLPLKQWSLLQGRRSHLKGGAEKNRKK